MPTVHAAHPSEFLWISGGLFVLVRRPVQAICFLCLVVDAYVRGVSKHLSTFMAFLFVIPAFVVAIAIVVVYFHASATVRAFNVFAHNHSSSNLGAGLPAISFARFSDFRRRFVAAFAKAAASFSARRSRFSGSCRLSNGSSFPPILGNPRPVAASASATAINPVRLPPIISLS